MTERIIRASCLLLLLLLSPFFLSAQVDGGDSTTTITINDVSLFQHTTATDVSFVIDDPASPGELPLITPAGTPTYLQYTVVVATGAEKTIQASCDTTMRDGLRMNIWAGAPTGTGGVGTALAGGLEVGTTYVADTAVDIIDTITSCATGSGGTQGPAVFCTLTIDESTFANMVTVASEVYTITYTMIDSP
ncbi:MAG: hypothetical protein JXR86_02925 [Spirochaetales bacterium]|nr:hypothetical protein [Spirochaetales bacterium]